MKHIIACRDSVYGDRETAFRLLPEAGITATEACGVTADDIDDVCDKARKTGITITTLGTGVNLSKGESITAFSRLIEGAARTNIKKIFTSIGAGDEDHVVCLDRLKELASLADRSGITICMETHMPFGHNGDTAMKTMTAVASSALRMNFDTANIYYYNKNIDTVQELKKVLPMVSSVHLKETDGGFESFNFPLFGEGIVNFPEVFRLLDGVGFEGPYTMELEGPLTDNKSVEERHAAVKSCMEYLKSIGVV
ncbi:MAG: sugar phosphate isomerase/epimerase [Lentisphaerae bacterium]|nr:sugar phosphate isomerase/epimerase [Lentisphaerota bacterium]